MTFTVASQYTGNKSSSKNNIPGMEYFEIVQQLLPQMLAKPSLEGVQSCLLIASYLLPLQGAETSYIYIRLAMQLAIAQGLHQADRSNRLSSAAQEVQNRVFWTTYIHERYDSLNPPGDVFCLLIGAVVLLEN
jgi:hypothetical protein